MRALLDATRALLAQLPGPQHKSYATYHARLEVDALRKAAEKIEHALAHGKPAITRDAGGRTLSVALADDDTERLLAVLW